MGTSSSFGEVAVNYAGRPNTGINLYNGSAVSKAFIAASGATLFVGGNVGIGTAVPAYLLHVGYPTATGAVLELQNSSGSCIYTPSSSGSFACSSDIRYKKDIGDWVHGLSWLQGLRVRDFTLKATGERQTGVVAQEVIAAHPEMVHLDNNGFYLVDQPNPWKLVKVMQEQQHEIEAQQGEIDNLKILIDQLRSQ